MSHTSERPPHSVNVAAPGVPTLVMHFLSESRLSGLLLASLSGLAGGAIASVMSSLAMTMHYVLFGVPVGQRLSGVINSDLRLVFLWLIGGGLLVGGSSLVWRRWIKSDIADPIEANALYGGRMSMGGSIFVAGQAVLSNGAGASVGLEGGFTQLASAFGSWLGQLLRRPRDDLRLLVACGAAGGIAGAFNAPFAGIAYAFELILASYSPNLLAPIVLAAISGKYAASFTAGHGYHIVIHEVANVADRSYLWSLVVGAFCGLAAIGLMRAVTRLERLASAWNLPKPLATAAGGLVMAILALASPHVLGAGHGGIDMIYAAPPNANAFALIFMLKIAACAISIGSGFRGGLFSASLFLGSLLGGGAAIGAVAAGFLPMQQVPMLMVVAMSAFAAAVVGTPLAMALLAAEVTGQIALIPDVLLSVIAATFVVRALFGYSFSIWRLHVRGSPARSAEDIAWARTIHIRDFMRPDIHKLPAGITCGELLQRYPPGSAKRVVLVDGEGHYEGLCDVAELAFTCSDPEAPAAGFAKQQEEFLTVTQSLDEALAWFERLGREAIVVVQSTNDPRVVGIVTDTYVLKRYAQELERRRRV